MPRVALRPSNRLDVFVEVLGAFFEVGEILVGQIVDDVAQVLFRQLDEVAAYSIPYSARPAVQHQPNAITLVQADLDEMVASSQRTQMGGGMRIARDFRMLCNYLLVAALE